MLSHVCDTLGLVQDSCNTPLGLLQQRQWKVPHVNAFIQALLLIQANIVTVFLFGLQWFVTLGLIAQTMTSFAKYVQTFGLNNMERHLVK